MDLEEFEDLVDRWGEDVQRWQSPFREQAAELLRTSKPAREILNRATLLRRAIADAAPVRAPAGLASRITAAAGRRPAAPMGGSDRTRQAWFEYAVEMPPLRSAVLLTLCFLIGASAALMSVPIQGNAEQVDFPTLLVRAVN